MVDTWGWNDTKEYVNYVIKILRTAIKFVMVCPKLETVRNTYLKGLVKPTNLHTFQNLMKCQKQKDVYNLTEFLREAWKFRLDYLNA